MKSVVFAVVALICVVHLKGIAADYYDDDDDIFLGGYRSVNHMAYPRHYPVVAPVAVSSGYGYGAYGSAGYGSSGYGSAGGLAGGAGNDYTTQFLTFAFLLPVFLALLNQNRNNSG